MFPLWSPKFNRRLLPRNLFGAVFSDEKKKESGHNDGNNNTTDNFNTSTEMADLSDEKKKESGHSAITGSDNSGIFDFADDDNRAKVTAAFVDEEVENRETHQSIAAAASTYNDGNNNTTDNFNQSTEMEDLNHSLDVAPFVDDSCTIIVDDTFVNVAALDSVDDADDVLFDVTVASKSTKEGGEEVITVCVAEKPESIPSSVGDAIVEDIDAGRKTQEIIDANLVSTQPQAVYFVFPFLGGDRVELAAKRLRLCDPMPNFVTADLITMQLEKTVGRTDLITMTDFDRQTLNPGVYVNDNVIDFWMMWLTRNVSDQGSAILIFTSHFYSCLISNNFGLQHVSQWIQNRRVDLFSKQIIMFPINLDQHWSLMVACYPGAVTDTDCAPIMLHLDSLRLHNGRIIAEKLRSFFNWEWSKKKGQSIGDIFTDVTYPVFSPDVPRQKNGFDCGLYICQYAFGIFKLREQIISEKDVSLRNKDTLTNMITKNPHLKFNQRNINQFRTQLAKLLDNLSQAFHGKVTRKKRAQLGNDTSSMSRIKVPRMASTVVKKMPKKGSRKTVDAIVENVLNATDAEHLNLTADNQQDKGSVGVQSAMEVDISIGNTVQKQLNTTTDAEHVTLGADDVLNATDAELLNLTADNQQDKGSVAVQSAMEVQISIGNTVQKQLNTTTDSEIVNLGADDKQDNRSVVVQPPMEVEATIGNTVEKDSNSTDAEHINCLADDQQHKGRKIINPKKIIIREVIGKSNAVTCASDVDPFIGKLVAIDLGSDFGKELIVTFGFKLTFDAVNFEMNTDAGHLLGTVMRKHNKTNRYEVVWQFTSLGETIVPLSAVLDGHKEAERLSRVRQSSSTKAKAKNKAVRGKKVTKENIDALLRELSDDEEEKGAPSSDGSVSDDDESNSEEESDWELFDPPISPREEETYAETSPTHKEKSNADNPSSRDIIDGLHWEFDGTIKELSPMMMPSTNTHMKPGKEHFFKTPVSSMMAIFPLLFWDKIVEEINRYAAQKIKLRLKMKTSRRPQLICGYKWTEVKRSEIMTYFGILIYCMLYPQTGRRIRDYWDSPYHNAWTKFMSRGRYQQITCVLHFNDNDDEVGKARDSLHKIRPLLNVVKKTLGRYAEIGSEISYDEATMANKSSYGRNLICFNPMKPTGKFHFKIYMICCAKTNLTIRMKIHTKDNADLEVEDEHHEFMNKLDNQTLQLCKPFYNSGSTVNMDNYYMSTTCAMKLRQNGIFCRGTIRSNRKYLPKSILFNASETRTMVRGTHRIAVNADHQMLAIGWLDNKPVHFVSTADTTEIVHVQRKCGSEKIQVSAPMAVANYNKYMGGVDRHDRLRSTFSLCKRLKFKKYYVKLLLFLVDIGLTNAWVYYKLCNEEKCKKEGARADFFQVIAECMVNSTTNWQEYDSTLDLVNAKQQSENLDTKERSIDTCLPQYLNNLPMQLSLKIKICQVCKYEVRKPKWKSVMFCANHGVRLCLEEREQRQHSLPLLRKKDGSPVTDWSWTCETKDSCWNKFHKFYLPQGLFNNKFSLSSSEKVKFANYVYTSPIYQKKYAALGIKVTKKNGKTAGVGRIDENCHMVKESKRKELAYLQQDSDDDDSKKD